MKKHILHISLALFMVFAISTNALAQQESRDNGSGPPLPPGHGQNEDQSGPIGGGLALLMAMGAAYGAKKVYDARKRLNG